MVAIQLDGVRKQFGDVVAVRDVSLTVERGQLFFLLGPSGCGKTTILRLIAGFATPEAGAVRFDGRDVTGLPAHRRNAAMVFQNYALWPHMTVQQNVAYGLEVRKVPRSERAVRCGEALALVQMGDYASRYPHQLSGGQQQRVAVARALVVRPDVLLMDEPLSNLDARLRVEMRAEIRRIHAETGLTVVYVTHDQKEALSLAQRIAVVDAGRVQQVGTPQDVYLRPANRAVAEFIGDVNLLPAVVEPGDPPRVRCALGTFALSLPPGAGPGSRLLCGVRPEAVDMADPADGRVPATVGSLVFTGETVEYALRLDSGEPMRVFALSSAGTLRHTGDRVGLTVAPESVFLLEDPSHG